MLSAIVGFTAASATVMRGWPQVSRIAVHKNTSGVSVMTWALMGTVNSSWSFFGMALGIPVISIGNGLAWIGSVAVLLTIARHNNTSFLLPLWTTLGSAVITFATLALLGETAISVLLMILGAVMLLPQVIKAYRFDPSGISASAYWLGCLSSSSWSLYYALINKEILILVNVVIFPCSVLILIRIYNARYKKRAQQAAPVFVTELAD